MLFWLLACVDPATTNNRMWIKEVLYADNWRYLQRSPATLEQKFIAMAESEYSFMRGTLSIQLAHWSRRAQPRTATQFLNIPESTMVPIFGDAHPENFTVSAHPSQSITTEIVDLDAAGFAPWVLDVRRALMGQRMFAHSMDDCDTTCQTEVVLSWIEGFQLELTTPNGALMESKIVGDLFEEAVEEGNEAKKYHKYTTDGQLNFDDELDVEGKGVFPLEPGDRTPQQIFAQFASTQDYPIRLLDVGQRFGMGISSRAALRYVFLWDTGLEGEEDNQMLLAREVFDLPDYPGRLGIESEPFESNAHRVTRMRHMLWSNPNADPNYMGFTTPFDFKTQSWSSYYQDVEVSKIQEDWNEGKIDEEDLSDLAAVMGTHHASVWNRAQTLNGQTTRSVVLEDIRIGGGFEVFTREMLTMSETDFAVQRADYEWFIAELQHSGPLLGLDALGVW